MSSPFVAARSNSLKLNFPSALIAGGGSPEIHVSRLLAEYSHSLKGMEAYCFQAYADALEVIPTTLAENAGLNPIAIVTELRNRHALGERNAGINVRTVRVHSWRSSPFLQTTAIIGPDLKHSGRGCCPASTCLYKCGRTFHRDNLFTIEDRRLCTGSVDSLARHTCKFPHLLGDSNAVCRG